MNQPAKQSGKLSGWRYGVFALIHWLLLIFFALITLALTMDIRKLSTPGASPVLLFSCMGVGAALTILLYPRISARMNKWLRAMLYFGIFGWCLLFGAWTSHIQPLWDATPEGKKEAAEKLAADLRKAVEEAEQAKVDRAARAAEAAQAEQGRIAQLEVEQSQKLEACFTTFRHRLPALEDRIRESLHNPDAFEHVETVAVGPDALGYNVEMRFRAENGFGAIRTGSVRAKVQPDDCSIVEVTSPDT